MRTRQLGPTDIHVSEIGLGCMPLSIKGRPDEKTAIEVIHAAFEAGITFLDTADVYCLDHRDIGHNERLVAKALAAWSSPDDIVVATKGGLERPNGDWTCNGQPHHLRAACEASLQALGIEAITLYQLHAPDEAVAFSDTMGVLKDLQQEGKIIHVGLSNVSVAELEEALAMMPIVSVQNRCNPFDLRAWDDGIISKCEQHGLAFLPYSPVGGSYGKGDVAGDATLNAIGSSHDASPFEVALAWLSAQSPMMLPIPGASRIASAISSARASELTLTPEDEARLQRAFPTS
jgi:aryl-alcohol dehydrogenase-like predicted oxidoreductase